MLVEVPYTAALEKWVECVECRSHVHAICGMYNVREYTPNDQQYTCPDCLLRRREDGAGETPLRAHTVLPPTLLDAWLASRIDPALACTVRVLAYNEETVTEGTASEARTTLCIGLFQQQHGGAGPDILVFVMYVTEFFLRKTLYLSYIDSVPYFEPIQQRSSTFRTVILEYFNYKRHEGFTQCLVWACPPAHTQTTYIFYVRPPWQSVNHMDKLLTWYDALVRDGQERGIVAQKRLLGVPPVPDWNLVRGVFEGIFSTKTDRELVRQFPPQLNRKKVPASRKPFFVIDLAPVDEATIAQARAWMAPGRIHAAALPSHAMFRDRYVLVCDRLVRYALVFDTRLRATYATLVLLACIADPDVTATYMCDVCGRELKRAERFVCTVPACGAFDVCALCHWGGRHAHPTFPAEKVIQVGKETT